MFKFIKQYAEKLEGVEIYPIFSLLVFFIFFVVLIVVVLRMKKADIQVISRIPLDNEHENTQS